MYPLSTASNTVTDKTTAIRPVARLICCLVMGSFAFRIALRGTVVGHQHNV